MAERSTRQLARIHRVRTLQLEQVRADEARAHDRLAKEAALRARIAALSAEVSPPGDAAPQSATRLSAAAHFRDRLCQSAEAAARRTSEAEAGLAIARERTHAAKRDQGAVEKLIARAEADEALKALRALESLPPVPRKRHDLC